jgi:hypothetical protein
MGMVSCFLDEHIRGLDENEQAAVVTCDKPGYRSHGGPASMLNRERAGVSETAPLPKVT